MPTYDYQCEKCEFEFEREQRITEDPIKTCPKCKSRKAKRLLSASNFILKGGGWYADGYASSGAKKSGDDSDSGSSSSTESSSDSSTKSDKTEKTEKTQDSSTKKAASDTSSGGKKSGSGKSGKSAAK